MTTTIDVSYIGPSPIHAGNSVGGGGSGGPWATPASKNVALIGDSLTTHLLGYNWNPFFWINGLAGGVLRLIANAGVAGEQIGNVNARVDNDYTDASPGLAGLPGLGFIFDQTGTNDARAAVPASSYSAACDEYFPKLAARANLVHLYAIPPIGPGESSYQAKNALTLEYNAVRAAYAAEHSENFVYVPTDTQLRAGDGSQLPGFFQSDGIHNLGAATTQEGIDGFAALSSLFAGYGYPSPLSTDPTDVYPAHPQWFTNPTFAGTSGSTGTGFTGSVVTGLQVEANGGGITGTCSIAAADVGDANQCSWQVITPTQVSRTGAGESIRISSLLAGRAISAVDPAALDMMVEVRMTGFNSTYFGMLKLWVQGSTGDPLTADLDLKIGGGPITKTLTLRHMMPRPSARANTYAALYIDLPIAANHTGSMGNIALRCISIRG
ncbi:MAG: SGNH/GDSL hydrolase family protein [Massilia sp.]